MDEYIELIDKYRIVQSKDTDYNPPSYEWVDNTGKIVRCKDCINHRKSGLCEGWSRYGTITTPDDAYCSYGREIDG